MQNYTYIPADENIVTTVREACQNDTPEYINSTHEATGPEIRRMMTRHGITPRSAAQILGRSPAYVRGKMKNGAYEGRESWEFLRFLPQRHKTMTRLNSSDSWGKATDEQEVKLILVKHWGTKIACMAIKLAPKTFDGQTMVRSCKLQQHDDAGKIHFGVIENRGGDIDGVPTLPVVTNRPSDHIRSTGSTTLKLAHEFCEQNWENLQCGDTVDVSAMASAQVYKTLCRSELLKQDARSRGVVLA